MTDTTNRQRLSVVMGVYNEEDKLARSLDRLTWADELVIVDKFSTDRTPEIARSYPRTLFIQNEDWLNVNVNLGLEAATGDWILQIDADEVVSDELIREIREILSAPDMPYDGYWVPSRVFFFGKWIRYGVNYDTRFGRQGIGFNHRQRLFRKGYAWYDCQHLHEPISHKGNWGFLRGHYDHLSHPSVSGWIEKMNRYTDRDMELRDVTRAEFHLPRPGKTLLALAKVFFHLYIKRKGYKDGLHGFIVCALNTLYLLVERCKVWEKHWRLTHPDEVVHY
jgi:glycosyltransferase involved in cell wall biosynthesis